MMIIKKIFMLLIRARREFIILLRMAAGMQGCRAAGLQGCGAAGMRGWPSAHALKMVMGGLHVRGTLEPPKNHLKFI